MEGTCKADDCDRPMVATGLCMRCYKRARRAADPEKVRAENRAYYEKNRAHVIAKTNAYKQAHPEKRREDSRRWREANKERIRDQDRAYVEANKERVRAQQAAWVEANRERVREARRQREDADYERVRKRNAEWMKANRHRMNEAKSRYRARQLGNVVTAADYRAILERDGMVCHICGNEIPTRSDLHFDHVIPLSKGGPHKPENIRPAHARCNLSKGDRIIAS